MAEDARQKITNVEKASLIASEFVIKPEKSNGAKTNEFFTHCFGRSSRSGGESLSINKNLLITIIYA